MIIDVDDVRHFADLRIETNVTGIRYILHENRLRYSVEGSGLSLHEAIRAFIDDARDMAREWGE